MKPRSRRTAGPTEISSGHANLSDPAFFRCKPIAFGVAACFAVASADIALALPVNPSVVAGQASFAQSGTTLTVTNTPGTIINWRGFSIGASELTRFVQPSASSAVMNRVTGAESSAILGTLQSNGRVFLLNPNGIVFGSGAAINVAGLVASSLDMSNADFLGGRLAFTAGAIAGSVVNQGAITTPTGGNVYLIAPDVRNSGVITSPGGEVVLAAGRSVQLVDIGTPDLRVEITAPGNEAVNLGEIAAQAGRIGVAGALARNSGTLNASSAVEEGGRVFLRASQDAYVDGAGRIVATGTKGGRVEVLGNRVAVMDQAGIDASGTNGGGTVLVGGDYQGRNPDVQNAQVTYFGPNASIRADAEKVGAGGTVIVWADDTTRAHGTISARGGAVGGDGGLVETSGKRWLDANGARVSAAAPKGKAGIWLLDPTDITIVHDTSAASDNFITSSSPFQASPSSSSTSTLSDYTINTALDGGTSVTITTSSAYGGYGDILFSPTVALVKSGGTAATSLFLVADRDISLRGAINNNSAYGLGVYLDAAGSIFTPGASSLALNGSGAPLVLQVEKGKTWYNYGTISLMGDSQIKLYDGTSPATLNNTAGANFWIQGTNSFPIASHPTSQDGIFNNAGTLHVQANASIEAQFNQTSGGITNITDFKTLSIQNLGLVAGTVNIGNSDGGATLWVSESHGSSMEFENAAINRNGSSNSLKIGGTSYTVPVTFDNVLAPAIDVTLDSKAQLEVDGYTKLASLSYTNSQSTIVGELDEINNGILGIVGNFSVPAGVTYTGNAAYFATGNLGTSVSGLYNAVSGNLMLVSGWDGANSTGTVTAGSGDLILGGQLITNAGQLTLRAGRSITASGQTITGTTIRMDVADDNGELFLNGSTLTASGLGAFSAGAVDLRADRMTLTGTNITVPDGGWVHLWPMSASRPVKLGIASNNFLTGNGGTLGLVAADLAGIDASSTATYGGARLQIDAATGTAGINIAAPVALDPTVNTLLLYNVGGSITQGAGSTLTANRLSVFAPAGDVALTDANNIAAFDTFSSPIGGELSLISVAPTLKVYGNILANKSGLANNAPAVQITAPNSSGLIFYGGNINAPVSGAVKLQAGSIDVNANPSATANATFAAYGDISLLTPVATGIINHTGPFGANISSANGAVSLIGYSINTGGTLGGITDVNISYAGNYTIASLITSPTLVTFNLSSGTGPGDLINGMGAGLINVAAPAVSITANGNVGSSTTPILTQTGALTAYSATGGVWIQNNGAVNLVGNNSGGTYALKAVGANAGITLAGAGNSLSAANGLFKADGAINLAGMNVAYLSAYSTGGYVRAFNPNNLILTADAWTGGTYSLFAGGVNATSGESVTVGALTASLNINGPIAGAAGDIRFSAPNIVLGTATGGATLSNAKSLDFISDTIGFGAYGGSVSINGIPGVEFSTYTSGRQIALYSTTNPCGSCLGIDLAAWKPKILGATMMGFGQKATGGGTPTGDITLHTGLTTANLPTGINLVGLLTGGSVIQNGQTIAVPSLGVVSGGAINLTTSVDNFAAKSDAGVTLSNSKALTLGNIVPPEPTDAIGGILAAGPVSITAAGTLTNYGGIIAGNGPVTLTTTAGNIVNNAPGIGTYGGNVTLRSAGNIATALIDAGTGTVNLVAYGGGIADLDGSAHNIVASALALDVAGISDFGTRVGALSGNTHGSNLKLAQYGGLTLTGLDLGAGNLDLTLSGGALSGPATGVGLTANLVKLAANSIDLNTQVAGMDATAANYINVTSGRSLGFAGVAGGDITVRTLAPAAGPASDITLGLVKALGKKVTVDAAGRIIDGNDGAAPALNIEAATLDLKSTAGIGVGNPLETKVAGITVLNGDGNVEIANQGLLALGPVTLQGTGDFKLDNVGKVETKVPINVYGGGFGIQAHSPIIIGAALTASGDIVLMTTDDGTSGDTITLNGVLRSLAGGVTLKANDSILQNANISTGGAGTVELVSTRGGIVMKSGTSITTVGGIIDMAANGNIILSLLDTGGVSGTVNVKSASGAIGSSITGNNINTRTLLLSASTGISNVAFQATAVNVSSTSGFVTVIDSNTGTVISDDPSVIPVIDEIADQVEQQISNAILASTNSLVPDEGDNSVTTLAALDKKDKDKDEDNKKKRDEKKTDEGKTDDKPKKAALPVCR